MAYRVSPTPEWWFRAFDGSIALLFGLAALLWPGLTPTVLLSLFAAYALISGVVALAVFVRPAGGGPGWLAGLTIGIAGVGVGALTLASPRLATVQLTYLLAFWALVVGLTDLAVSVPARRGLVAVVGTATTLLGLLLLGDRAAGALTLAPVISIFALLRGGLELLVAARPSSLLTRR